MRRRPATIAQLRRAKQLIDERFHEPLDLRTLALAAGLSPFHFLRLFRDVFACTPHQYLQSRRLERARHLLLAGRHSVTDVCFEVGFQSVGSFSALFHRRMGYPPAVYRTRRLVAVPAIVAPRLERFVPGCYLLMGGGRLPAPPAAGRRA